MVLSLLFMKEDDMMAFPVFDTICVVLFEARILL